MPSAILQPIQGQTIHPHAMVDIALAWFGQIPRIGHQGARQVQQWRGQHNNVNNNGNGNSDGSNTNNKDGDSNHHVNNKDNNNDSNNGNNNDGEVDGNGSDNNNDDNDDINDNGNLWQCQWYHDRQPWAGRNIARGAPPIQGNNLLMRMFGEKETREGKLLGEGKTE